MNYVRRAGRFVRKKLGSAHGSRENQRHHSALSETSSSTSHGVLSSQSPPAHSNGHTWTQDPAQYLHNDAVSSVAAVGANVCLSGGKDNIVALFDYERRSMEAKWSHNKEVTMVLPGRDGVYYSASRDRTIRSWRVTSQQPQQTFTGHEFVVTAVDVSRDYTKLCSGSRDNSLKLWDIETASCVRSVSISRNLVTDLKLGHDRPIIVQSSEDKELHLWDSRNLSVIQTFRKKMYIQTACDLDKEDMYCISASNGFGGNGCEATLWDLRATEPVLEYRGHHETVSACAFVPSMAGRELIMTSSHDSTVRVWDKHSAACLCCLSIPGSGPLTSISVGPDHTFLISSFNRGVLRLAMEEHGDQLRLDIIDVF